ncbi:MAG TPA: MMPL family transporter [Myxococcales bacterium]|nr:MMPL family transporter [Myxococcales bacterium]
MSHGQSRVDRALHWYADLLTAHPGRVLVTLLVLTALSGWAASRLRINSNQLDLISQDLPEIKDVKRVIDMVGGAGHLIIAFRSSDEKAMKAVADDVSAFLASDKKNVRWFKEKLPVEFIQEKMVLFIKPEDLQEAKTRINAYLKDQLKRNNPFYIELRKTEPVKLNLDDLIAKYGKVNKKSILDDYYISDDKLMVLLIIKPMWDSGELAKTKEYLENTLDPWMRSYSKNGVRLAEDYKTVGDGKSISYGYTGSYKLSVDDSYAIDKSLGPVTWVALVSITLITMLFFWRVWPTFIVMSGVVVGTVLSMGFTWATIGTLNMITSMLAALIMGFGVDFGIHFTFRTRLELGLGQDYRGAIHTAMTQAGRPALVAATVTAGSFFVLLASQFRGFSQFGFLAGSSTFILAVTLFSWTPSILMLLGNRRAELVAKTIGVMPPPPPSIETGDTRIRRPALVLAGCLVVVFAVSAFAIPWTDFQPPHGQKPTLVQRLKMGVRFDYNTRALIPPDEYSVQLNDEINQRFQISADPTAVYTRTLEEAKEVFDELWPLDRKKYSTVDQALSIYNFVPPPETAAQNAKILAEWDEELKDIDVASLPPEMQDKAAKFKKILAARPYGIDQVPEEYAAEFRHLPTTRPENHGYLTFLYPTVDLWDGKNMIAFRDQTAVIHTKEGHEFRSAGLPILYAKLADIVLYDGKLTFILAAIWILTMHYLDFRRFSLTAASVLPLGLGILMMLGIMSMMNERLNFMNIVMLPLLLGFGVSHGLYLCHRFLEGTSPLVALRSVGAAVASSTLTTIAGFASLFAAEHNGLKSMGLVACLGLTTTLIISFTVLAAVLQIIHDQRTARAAEPGATPQGSSASATALREEHT